MSRLLRVGPEATGLLFGDDVDVAEEDDDTPTWLSEASKAIDQHAVRVSNLKPVPSLKGQLREWLVETLADKRGVLAALPGREVIAINPAAVAGTSWWWLWHLQRTRFSKRDSHTTRNMETVYRLGGAPDAAFNWFPCGGTYGLEKGVLSRFIEFGLAVTVREFAPATHDPAPTTQAQIAATSIFLALEAASLDVGPAVLAAMLVFDGDEFQTVQQHSLPSDAAFSRELSVAKESRRVVASVVVQQLHTYTLSDMLGMYENLGSEQNTSLAASAISAAIVETVSLIRKLASAKMLKLDMTADTVVFCPLLEDTGILGEFAHKGIAFGKLVAGMPRLTGFDHRTTKRMHEHTGYDANLSMILMTTTLLASVRVRFPAAYSMVVYAVMTDELKQAWVSASKRFDGFSKSFTFAFQHTRIEREPLPRSLFDEVIDDLSHLVRSYPRVLETMQNGERIIYQKLLEHTLNTRSLTAVATMADEERVDAALAHKRASARIAAVQRSRVKRLLVLARLV